MADPQIYILSCTEISQIRYKLYVHIGEHNKHVLYIIRWCVFVFVCLLVCLSVYMSYKSGKDAFYCLYTILKIFQVLFTWAMFGRIVV